MSLAQRRSALSHLSARDAEIARLIEQADILGAEADADGDTLVAEHFAQEARELEAQLSSARHSRTLNFGVA